VLSGEAFRIGLEKNAGRWAMRLCVTEQVTV
jgi:hypothetical protein